MDNDASDCDRNAAEPGGYGLRTACWLRARSPTECVRQSFETLPPTRVVRHGDYVHVLYDVDRWSGSGAITREDVVARLRAALFFDEIGHELALGHFVCETDAATEDRDELRLARSGK